MAGEAQEQIPRGPGRGGGIDSEGEEEIVIAEAFPSCDWYAALSVRDWQGERRAQSPFCAWRLVDLREEGAMALGYWLDAVSFRAEAGSGAEPRGPVSVGAALWGARPCAPSSRRSLSVSSLPFLSSLLPSLVLPVSFLLASWRRGCVRLPPSVKAAKRDGDGRVLLSSPPCAALPHRPRRLPQLLTVPAAPLCPRPADPPVPQVRAGFADPSAASGGW